MLTKFDSKRIHYEYYPNLWFGTDKQYEAQPGESYDQTKAYIKAVFDKSACIKNDITNKNAPQNIACNVLWCILLCLLIEMFFVFPF